MHPCTAYTCTYTCTCTKQHTASFSFLKTVSSFTISLMLVCYIYTYFPCTLNTLEFMHKLSLGEHEAMADLLPVLPGQHGGGVSQLLFIHRNDVLQCSLQDSGCLVTLIRHLHNAYMYKKCYKKCTCVSTCKFLYMYTKFYFMCTCTMHTHVQDLKMYMYM